MKKLSMFLSRILLVACVLTVLAGTPTAHGQYGSADDPPTAPLYVPPVPVVPTVMAQRIGIQMRDVYYLEPGAGWIYAVQVLHQVEPGSPAGRAGIEPGDMITRINGVRTFNHNDVQRLIGQAAGDVIVRLRDVRTGRYVDTQLITPLRLGGSILIPPGGGVKKEPQEEDLD